jgi:hypothetical protein
MQSGRTRLMSRAGETGFVTWSPDASSTTSRAGALLGQRPQRAVDADSDPWRCASGEGKSVCPRMIKGAIDSWGEGFQPGSRGVHMWGTGEHHEYAVGR